jgi:hypothetical protein
MPLECVVPESKGQLVQNAELRTLRHLNSHLSLASSDFNTLFMKTVKPRSPTQLLLLAIAIGFLLSFLSVIAAIALSINDHTLNVPTEVHLAIWACGTVIALLVLWRRGN